MATRAPFRGRCMGIVAEHSRSHFVDSSSIPWQVSTLGSLQQLARKLLEEARPDSLLGMDLARCGKGGGVALGERFIALGEQ